MSAPCIIVAGGSGFCGSHLMKSLVTKGTNIILLSRGVKNIPKHLSSSIHSVPCDLTLPLTSSVIENIQNICKGKKITCVINLIGIKKEDLSKNQTFFNVHCSTVDNLLKLCSDLQIHHFIHISVMSACKDLTNTNSYHHTKYVSEQSIIQYSKEHNPFYSVIIRPSIIWGEGDDMIRNMVRGIKHMALFPIPSSIPNSSYHQPVHVSDVVKSIEDSLSNFSYNNETSIDSKCDIVQVVGPDLFHLPQMIDITADAISLPVYKTPIPYSLLSIGANIMCKIPSFDPLITPAQLKMLYQGMSIKQEQLTQTPATKTFTGSVHLTTESVQEQENILPSEPLFGISTRLIKSNFNFPISLFGMICISWILFPMTYFISSMLASYFIPPYVTVRYFIGNDFWYSMTMMHTFSLLTELTFGRKIVTKMINPSVKKLFFAFLFAILCAIISIPGNMFLCSNFSFVQERFDIIRSFWLTDSPNTLWKSILTSVIFIPSEEITFRGFLLLAICSFTSKNKYLSPFCGWISCILSSIIWGVLNMYTLGLDAGPLIFPISVFMGSLWCFFFLKSSDIFSTIVTHIIYDAIMIWWSF